MRKKTAQCVLKQITKGKILLFIRARNHFTRVVRLSNDRANSVIRYTSMVYLLGKKSWRFVSETLFRSSMIALYPSLVRHFFSEHRHTLVEDFHLICVPVGAELSTYRTD